MNHAKFFLGEKILSLCQKLQITGVLSRATIFSPPTEPHYTMTEFYLNDETSRLDFIPLDEKHKPRVIRLPEGVTTTSFKLNDRRKGRDYMVPLIYLSNQNFPKDKVIIYSHGTSSDLGDNYIYLLELMSFFECNVISYDYAGYGIAPNKPTENTVYRDLESVIAFATQKLDIPLNGIVLWGFSLGCGPSVELAVRYPSIAGLILQAPLASLLAFLDPDSIHPRVGKDMFASVSKMANVKCGICFIHGTLDQTIPIKHSELLAQRYAETHDIQPSFIRVEGGRHNDSAMMILKSAEAHKAVLRELQIFFTKGLSIKPSIVECTKLEDIFVQLRIEPSRKKVIPKNNFFSSLFLELKDSKPMCPLEITT
eukprot:TRINITY_DN1828_c0_g1_i7.p1 TRINITY_DN1828_c0_g1~~TRINITY_DN1828_c0_g1_i7.p1  ORF type:complete len:368 (+),score=48.44 TRINITY_DN1828_c0_g1_i7:75-1178(+)